MPIDGIDRAITRWPSRHSGHSMRCWPALPDRSLYVLPVQSAFIERFNRRFCDGCLNQHWFVSMAQARRVVEAWRFPHWIEPHAIIAASTVPVLSSLAGSRPT